jgi:hypothetical protein
MSWSFNLLRRADRSLLASLALLELILEYPLVVEPGGRLRPKPINVALGLVLWSTLVPLASLNPMTFASRGEDPSQLHRTLNQILEAKQRNTLKCDPIARSEYLARLQGEH